MELWYFVKVSIIILSTHILPNSWAIFIFILHVLLVICVFNDDKSLNVVMQYGHIMPYGCIISGGTWGECVSIISRVFLLHMCTVCKLPQRHCLRWCRCILLLSFHILFQFLVHYRFPFNMRPSLRGFNSIFIWIYTVSPCLG